MQTTETIQPSHSAGDRHEMTDISVKTLGMVILIGAIGVLLTLIGVYWLFFAFGEIDRRFLDNPPMTTIKAPKIEPREPRIQGIPGFHTDLPWQDATEMKKDTAAELSSYGRSDEDGYVHIPITQAMRQLASDGSLKVRSNPNIPNNQEGADVAP